MSAAAKQKIATKMRAWHARQRRIQAAIDAETEQKPLPVKNGFASLTRGHGQDELVLRITELADDSRRTAMARLSMSHLEAIAGQVGFRLVQVRAPSLPLATH